ncbi:MAG: recombinase family protein, partial [Oscillospiraceae bacterium]|nr:recombinase family protein [Oscillospiraceae bacterium]
MMKQNNEDKRSKIQRRYGSATRDNVEVRPARKEKSIFDKNENLRVAIYCRVSTGNPEQLSSYIMQQEYYKDYVEQHPNWILVDIYADEGISGTSLRRRTEFLRMMKDCDDGKIDIIVVKSVSRFARCTEDFIACLRHLANHKPPIGVFFETESIYTLDESKQLTLTLLAGFAQEESHSKSENANRVIEQNFKRHRFLTPPLLGFDNDEDGNLVINKDEAETVKLIFAMYQTGHSCDTIASTLEAYGRKTKLGNTRWTPSSIHGVLHNERHCGDIIARKTWTPNYLDHKSVKNRVDENGEWDKPQYYEPDHHEAIISRDDYIAVQKMLANAKYGGKIFMPELRVNCGGALHGFVSINPRWGAFNTDDYLFASKTVGVASKNNKLLNVKRREADLSGYEIARAQLFNTADKTSGTFYDRNARFSGECIRKLGNAEYVEILVQPTDKLLAVRECSPEHRNAIKWAKFIGEKAYTRQFGGAAYLGTMFDIFGWNFAWG